MLLSDWIAELKTKEKNTQQNKYVVQSSQTRIANMIGLCMGGVHDR